MGSVPVRGHPIAEGEAFQRLLKSFVQNAPVALAITDRRLRFIEVSPRWRSEHGLRGQVRGRRLQDVFPEAYPRLGVTWHRVLDGETISTERVAVPCPDGKTRWMRVEVAPWRDAAGRIGGVVAMDCDITDMVASLERAERSERRLQLAIEIANFMFYDVDRRSGELTVGGARGGFYDHPPTYEELAADPWSAIHPDDRETARALWDKQIRAGEPFRAEHRLNRADGKEVWVHAGAEVIRDADGKPLRLIGVMKDVTERRQAQQALVAARDAAEAANRAKSDFLANMSHEIRTPLNGIVGVAAALGRTRLTAEQAEMVELIQTSGAALETILTDILDFSRIEAGRLKLRIERFELGGCLRSAANLFATSARDKGLTFSVGVGQGAEAMFEGDAGRIRQVLFNLLSNAVKFTREGGIEVRAAVIGETDDGAQVEISVADTGIGFDEATKARLFERFEQGDGSNTREFGGSGLGLAISRSLAEAMGGMLDAASTPGEGSRFVLSLPLKRAGAGNTMPEPAAEAPALEQAPRVLLAEDHAVNRRVVELILDAADVELVCVENGRAAVEAARGGSFDLILMDMQMPEMDGLTAISAIRADEKRRRRPPTAIWGLSANALPEHAEASLEAGADGHLAKPVSAPALFQVLAEACAARPRERLSA